MQIIDLSGAIASGLWTYGAPSPDVEVKMTASLEDDGFEAAALTMSILTGSYLETGKHLFAQRPSLDEMPPARFISAATVLQLPKTSLEPITAADLEKNRALIFRNPTLIIGTGWGSAWNSPEYLRKSPFFAAEAIEWLTDSPVNLLGADLPVYNDPRGAKVNVLHLYYRKEQNMIVAPLVNVGAITRPEVKLLTVPIKIKGQCAAPCRVLALQE